MSTTHPTVWDKFVVKVFPRYLYQTQTCLTLATTNIGMIHKVPDIKPYWKIMDYLFLQKDSTLKYLGLAKDIDVAGDVLPNYSVFELIHPLVDENKSPGKHAAGGDIICITPFDRQFIVAAPENHTPSPSEPIYFTAAS